MAAAGHPVLLPREIRMGPRCGRPEGGNGDGTMPMQNSRSFRVAIEGQIRKLVGVFSETIDRERSWTGNFEACNEDRRKLRTVPPPRLDVR